MYYLNSTYKELIKSFIFGKVVYLRNDIKGFFKFVSCRIPSNSICYPYKFKAINDIDFGGYIRIGTCHLI